MIPDGIDCPQTRWREWLREATPMDVFVLLLERRLTMLAAGATAEEILADDSAFCRDDA